MNASTRKHKLVATFKSQDRLDGYVKHFGLTKTNTKPHASTRFIRALTADGNRYEYIVGSDTLLVEARKNGISVFKPKATNFNMYM